MVLQFLGNAFKRPVNAPAAGTSSFSESAAQLSGISQARIVGSQFRSVNQQVRAGPGGRGGTRGFLSFTGIPEGQAVSIAGTHKGLVGKTGINWEGDALGNISLIMEKAARSNDVWQVGASVNYRVEYDKWVEVGAAEGAEPQPYFRPGINALLSEQPRILKKVFFSKEDKFLDESERVRRTMNWGLKEMAKVMKEEMLKEVPVGDTGFLKGSIDAVKIKETGKGELPSQKPLDVVSRRTGGSSAELNIPQ